MQLTKYFYKKLHDQMKIIDILPTAPKTRIRLDPIDIQDLCVDLQVVQRWSSNNSQLLHLILQNGHATFLCNKQFIYNHYEQLIFINKNINIIDIQTKQFTKLRILNLSQNNISQIQNLPSNLQQLYLDYNCITNIKSNKQSNNLLLLSISNNNINNDIFIYIISQFHQLRCLNIANNLIDDIRIFVNSLHKLNKIKILYSHNNPISLLHIYYQYITQNIQLKIIDGQKYIKPQPIKKLSQPKPQPKQQPKQQKKDPKKDIKKNSKQPQPKIQKLKTQPIIQPKKKQLTQNNFTICNFHLNITNFQNFTGNLYDPSLFPSDCPIDKTQTTYWVQYSFMGTNQQFYNKKVKFDQATIIENQPNRLSFSLQINTLFSIKPQNKQKFQNGIFITIHSQQPLIQINQSGQQKIVKQGNDIVMKKSIIGQLFVDLRQLLFEKIKSIQKLYRIWQPQICSRPYFKNPIQNQQKQINKRKQQFELKLKKQEEQKNKLLEQQQAAKNQKKGGKDAKKADKKPTAKKQGKQVVSDKKTLQRSTYPLDNKLYCYLNENKLYKARKQTLAIKVFIQ